MSRQPSIYAISHLWLIFVMQEYEQQLILLVEIHSGQDKDIDWFLVVFCGGSYGLLICCNWRQSYSAVVVRQTKIMTLCEWFRITFWPLIRFLADQKLAHRAVMPQSIMSPRSQFFRTSGGTHQILRLCPQ